MEDGHAREGILRRVLRHLPPLSAAALSALLLVTASVRTQSAPPPVLPVWVADVTQAIEAEMQRAGIPGLSAAIGVAGEITFSRGFGKADLENDVDATAQTVYRLASISKPITAVLAMQLAQQGKLDLDADVHTLVAAWPAKPWPVTTRQLLSHLGGVRHYQGEAESVRHYRTQTEALAVFANDPLLHEPGTKYSYSTYGYNLVAAVIEHATGQPFAQVVHERIAVPCGAETLRDDDVRALIRGRAQGYVRVAGELQNSELMDGSYKFGGGGLCASAEDLVRFAQALQAGKLVSADTLLQMWTQQHTRAGEPIDYALGFRVGSRAGRRFVFHGGAQSRVSTVLYLLPDDGLVIVLFCNLEGVKLQSLAERLGDRVLAVGK
jgi:CubicO group peptidase (beta-lactamase class C family)